VCQTAPGIGTQYRWRIEHSDGNGATSFESSQVTSYEAPSIDSLVPSYGASSGGRYDGGYLTVGGEIITLIGDNFGPSGSSLSATYRNLNASGMFPE
jgi:hypothetical protein